MRLLKSELLVKTGDVDHASWNYRPVLGRIQRLRFKLAKSLLNDTKCHRLLEIGYGSGVFMPELSRYCEELVGVDIHSKSREVQRVLEQEDIKTRLFSASIECTSFPSDYFDFIIAVSALEFVHDVNAACLEICRILKPEGFLIVVTPGHSKILDIGLKILTGESAKRDFCHRRELLVPALLERFTITQSIRAPRVIGRIFPLYYGLKLRPIQETSSLNKGPLKG
jgi:ubiquinone/menaquinone biosynthesis C-methylase UbiE